MLATGAANRRLAVPGTDLAGVHELRTLADAEALRRALGTARSAVVVGAGFIGLEFAAAARKRGIDVTVLEAADRPLARAVSPAMADHLADAHRRMGTDLRLGEGLAALAGRGRSVAAAVGTSGREYPADLVVLAVGRPPAGRARPGGGPGGRTTGSSSTSACAPPIPTSTRSATAPASRGTVPARASGWSPCRTRPTRAGGPPTRSSAGARRNAEVPWFWSNQGPLRLQIAGVRRPGDSTVVTGDVASGRFSVFCYRDARLVAVESLNRPADHVAARRVLATDDRPTAEQVADPDFSLKTHVHQLAATAS